MMEMTRRTTYEWEVELAVLGSVIDGSSVDSLKGQSKGEKKKLTGKFLLSRLNKKKKKKIVTNWEKFQHDCVGYKVDVRQTL